MPAPTIRLAQARAEVQIGRLIAAQQHMLDAAHSPAKAGQPPSWAAARKDAANEASALNARFASLELSIAPASVAPIVTIDGQSVAATTLSVPRALNPGAHAVHVEASGFRTIDQSVTLHEGERQKLDFTLESAEPVAQPAPPPPVQPTIAPPPIVTEPPQPPPPPPPAEPSQPTTSGSLALSVTGFSVAGVGLIVGSAMGIASLSTVSDLKSACNGKSCSSDLASKGDEAKTQGNISTVAFIFAGGGLSVGILTIPRSSSPSPRASIGFSVGPDPSALRGRSDARRSSHRISHGHLGDRLRRCRAAQR